MAGRSIKVIDIREIIKHLRMEETERNISKTLGVNRRTVAKYKSLAEQHNLLQGDLPDLEAIESLANNRSVYLPGQQMSMAQPFHDTIEELLQRNCTAQVIFERLRDNYSFNGSYDSVRRYVKNLKVKNPEAFIRMEVDPGAEAQVDFGYCGRMFDAAEKRLRKVWCFVMILGFSRHMFGKFVFDQKIATWMKLHREGFEFFGGVTAKVVLDNCKTAITKACSYDTEEQRSYSGCAEHYNFIISPCRPGAPHHKGKVESGGIKYVKMNFLPGREFIDIDEANITLLHWCLEKAKRVHGTTKKVPLEVFEKVEKKALQPLPRVPYEICWWKECKLHPDCHIVFEGSYYSAPFRLIGKKLWVKITDEFVRIFYEHKQVAVHIRANRKGKRTTLKDHLPPDKLLFFMKSPTWCREQAEKIGENASSLVERLLSNKPLDKLRTVQGILKMGEKYGAKRLEGACRRALFYNDVKYATIKNILEKELDKEPLEEEMPRRYFTTGKYARYSTGDLFNEQSADTTA